MATFPMTVFVRSVMSASQCTCSHAVFWCTHKPRQFWRCWCQWRYRSYLLATLAPADFRQWCHLVLPGSGCWSRFSSLLRSVWHYRNLLNLPSLGTQPGMAPILGSKNICLVKSSTKITGRRAKTSFWGTSILFYVNFKRKWGMNPVNTVSK